jgi:hypothetical protein
MLIARDKIHCAICGSISNRTTEVDDTVLCEHCFDMMLTNGLLFEYEADTDWHYGLSKTLDLDRLEDRQAVINDVLEIVELLK